MHSEFHLGPWLIEPALYSIKRGDDRRRLGPKAMALLLCLAEEPGKVVTKEELITRVWEGRFTSDEVLTTAVYELRKALDDSARQPRYIDTIRKRGYRLITQPVESLDDALPSPPIPSPAHEVSSAFSSWSWRTVTALAASFMIALSGLAWGLLGDFDEELSTATVFSLTVRPFTTLTEECGADFFGDGLTARLTAELASPGSFDLLPGASAAIDNDADAVIEGSVLRSGDRLWLSVQVIDTYSGRIIWGAAYERQILDALDLQQELATEIAQQIRSSVVIDKTVVVRAMDSRAAQTSQVVEPFPSQMFVRPHQHLGGDLDLPESLLAAQAPAEVDF